MTSREALKKLYNNTTEYTMSWNKDYYEIIEKDLENYDYLKSLVRRLIVLEDTTELLEENKERLKEILDDENI